MSPLQAAFLPQEYRREAIAKGLGEVLEEIVWQDRLY